MEKSSANAAPSSLSPKRSDLPVYVFNVVEDEWPFISSISDPVKRFEYITDDEDATDAYFMAFATEPNFAYISPKPISVTFQTYAKSLLGYQTAHLLYPVLRSHLICEDLVNDAKTFSGLVSIARNYKRIVLTSYAASQELYSLKESLQRVGLEVYLAEAPRVEHSWTVNFFGSKSGIRQLAQQSKAVEPDFMMPDGIICTGLLDIARIAASRYLREKGVVIKTNKGSGGSGVLIYREGELPMEYKTCTKVLMDELAKDRYWDIFPTVVENLVNINFAMAGGFPNVEFKIHRNGHIEMLYVCSCLVTPKGKFLGIDINEGIINDRIQTRIEDTGYFIAEQYAAAGYRGHFDVDMLAAKNGQVYVCESNTRNTGGTDLFILARKLIGKNFMQDVYSFNRSRSHWFMPKKLTLDTILESLNDLLYEPQKRAGVIINSGNYIEDGKLVYSVIAKDKKAAYLLEDQLISKLSILPNLGEEFPSPEKYVI